jgi:pSer/pThr/pTyr-binding forkhead associated (FHA) protein
MASYGKLRLNLPDGLEQEYELGNPIVQLGRAQTNEVVIADSRVSRFHARLECSPQGFTIVDLGSANRTLLNDVPVERATLTFGDVLTLGHTTLRLEPASPEKGFAHTRIDNESVLNATLAESSLDIHLNNTAAPRLVVYTPLRTWEKPLFSDVFTIGRTADNDILVDHAKVSRHHARIERRGERFTLRDLGSTNGTWLRDRRIETHTLSDGDSVKIGDAQLLFKSGFTTEDMTLDGTPAGGMTIAGSLSQAVPRRPVVFVPGFLGSELWLGSERVWPNVRALFSNPELFRMTDDSPLEARAILNRVVIVPNLLKLEQYSRLGDYLVEELGYQRQVDFFEFPYDFRRDLRHSAQRLAQMIDAAGFTVPITLIAHSMGTLVCRYYVEKLGGKRKVERLILMGGPHQGTPEATTGLVPAVLPIGRLGEKLRQSLITFPSLYQILPRYVCIHDQDGRAVTPIEDEGWLTPAQLPLLQNARLFLEELGMRTSVPTISVFGYGMKTITRLQVLRDSDGAWKKVVFEHGPSGDGTIPQTSAVLPGSEIHPVQQYHGVLFVDNDVKMRLKMELSRGASV